MINLIDNIFLKIAGFIGEAGQIGSSSLLVKIH